MKNPSRTRLAGLLLPAFTPRRKGDLGIGDTKSLCGMIDWASASGIGFLQLLPVNEMGTDRSPYSAISSAAFDPIYLTLDHETLPWLPEEEWERSRRQLEHAIVAPAVDYPTVQKGKRHLLELAWKRFNHAASDSLRTFREFRQVESEWLDDYCLFKLLMEFFGNDLTWDEWPESCRTPESARAFVGRQREQDPDAVESRLGYFAFVQWLCYRQWAEVRDHAAAKSVRLMGDIPIGISWHSCDVFFYQDEFRPGWFGGTPPEGGGPPFLTQWGQNWGVPLYNWDHMAKNDYRWWRTRVRHLTRFFDLFRLDHILGFYRIYAFPWHPRRNQEFVGKSHHEAMEMTGGLLPRWFDRPDDNETNKVANRAQGDARLRAVIAAAGDAEIIAEDLGWVPDYVRPHLNEIGIAGYRIPHWDCDSAGNPPPGNSFPSDSFASYSTHDHDPVCAIWRGCLGTIRRHQHAPDEVPDWQVRDARNTLRILAEFSGIPVPQEDRWPEYGDTVKLRLFKALFDANSRFAAIMVNELFDQDERINRPGASDARNWSYRLPWNTDELATSTKLSELSRTLRSLISLSGRLPPQDD